MTRFAIISDIHGNLHALEAVLAHLRTKTFDQIVCLGDIVGYGPAPDSCLDLVVKHCSVIIQGNHDEAVVDPDCAEDFNGPARDAIFWTRDALGPLHLNALNRLRATALIGEHVMCVHDSPVAGPTDYVHDPQVAARAFGGVDKPLCLLGHTHVPMVFETASTDPTDVLTSRDVTAYLPHDGTPVDLDPAQRYICNPGSVGQPRDCDPRASFAILDLEERTFTVHRQEYDVAGAQAATQAAGLPTILAHRLAVGA